MANWLLRILTGLVAPRFPTDQCLGRMKQSGRLTAPKIKLIHIGARTWMVMRSSLASRVAEVFASPSAQVFFDAFKAVNGGPGIACLYGNY